MSKENSKKSDTPFWQKVILVLITVSIPALVKLFMHHDSKEKIQKQNPKKEITNSQDTIPQEKKITTVKIATKNTINNNGNIGTIITDNHGEIVINNEINTNDTTDNNK